MLPRVKYRIITPVLGSHVSEKSCKSATIVFGVISSLNPITFLSSGLLLDVGVIGH